MPIYKDPSQPVEARVEDLLCQMTLEEKAAQLCGDLPMFAGQGITPELLQHRYPDGHGRFTQFSTMGLQSAEQIAQLANDIQRYFVEDTRLGIPVVFQTENLCGYPAEGGTLFPSMANVAATWDPDLAEKMSSAIGQETRAVGITSAMSPVIDVSRDPRWGRTYETFGEDPYLISQMGVAYIKGMQGNKKDGVACIAKHFLGYSETQGGLNTAVSRITDRELYEVFATPFEAAAKEADVSGMMASYSEIDGLPVGMNPKISRTLLRDTMQFRGMLTSDGAGVMKMFNYFKVASTYEEAGLLAKRAGLDTEIPIGDAFRHLPEYVRAGKLDEAALDESVRRILTIKFEYGLFEHPYVNVDEVRAQMTNDGKRALADEIAEKSLVLLQNDGVLPLKKGTRVALIGPHADSLRDPVSGYTYPAYIEMLDAGRKGQSTTFNGIADEAEKAKQSGGDKNPYADIGAEASDNVEPGSTMRQVLRSMGATTLREEMEHRFEVRYAKGCSVIDKDASGFDAAVTVAEKSDIVVMALGGNCGWVNVTGGEGKDRCKLDLPGVQQQLLEAITAVGKPVVVILYGPGIFALPWAVEHTAAMIQAWMPGAGAGRSVAKLLAGEMNPSGKLPFTIPRNVGQLPITYNQRVGSSYTDVGEDAAAFIFSGGYVDDVYKPLFPFGYGQSYTSFALSEAQIYEDQIATDGAFTIECVVTNTGGKTGDQVVQLYTRFDGAHVVRPAKQLTGFSRVHLRPGEKKRVKFTVQCSQLGYYNEDMRFVVEPGRLNIMLGTSADDICFTQSISIFGPTVEILHKRSFSCKVEVI